MLVQQASISFQTDEQPCHLPRFGNKAFLNPMETYSEKEQALRRMKLILDKLTFENFDLLKGQLESGIKTPELLEAVVTMIFDKAVFQPMLCPMYAQLCAYLNDKVPPFLPEKDGERYVTVRRILLNMCQEAFEGSENLWSEIGNLVGPDQEMEYRDKEKLVKLWTLGNIQLICELWKEEMVPDKIVYHIIRELFGPDTKACPTEVNVEAICQLFNSIGVYLDDNPMSRYVNDTYFKKLKDLTTNPLLTTWLRFKVRNVLELRANDWVIQRKDSPEEQFECVAYRAASSLRKAVAVFEEYEKRHRGKHHTPFKPNSLYFAATCAVLLCIVSLTLGVLIGKRL